MLFLRLSLWAPFVVLAISVRFFHLFSDCILRIMSVRDLEENPGGLRGYPSSFTSAGDKKIHCNGSRRDEDTTLSVAKAAVPQADKRHMIVGIILRKNQHLLENVEPSCRPPAPTNADFLLSKRAWETKLYHWRVSLRTLADAFLIYGACKKLS